jgi:3-hydroxy-3-methylglutaryl CoA synthase
MCAQRSRGRSANNNLVQAEIGIVGMAVVTLLVSLAGLWFSRELSDTTKQVKETTVGIQSSFEAYKSAMKSADTGVVLFTDQGTKSDNKNVEVTAAAAASALEVAERDTKESVKLLDQVLDLLATYETVTVTFGASAFIFALFVAIRRYRM